MQTHARKIALLIAITGWFAVICQLVLMLLSRTVSITETLLRFFSYFTILTNLLITVSFTSLAGERSVKWYSFFSKPATQTACTVYIIVVGVIYNLVLRSIWSPTGLQKLTDELLHSVIPILSLIYWLSCVNKKQLTWKNSFAWLLYPALYSLFIGIRGAVSGFYPYPFINVTQLGYPKTFTNGFFLLLFFWILSLLLIVYARLSSSSKLLTKS